MLFHTHLLGGIAVFLFLDSFFPLGGLWLFLGILLGSLLPDIDEQHSKINRWSGIFGIFVAAISRHRGFFHSLLFFLGLALLIQLWQPFLSLGLLIGYGSHLILDGLTPMGVHPLYPFSSWAMKGPLRTGSFAEHLLFLLLAIIVIIEVFP